MAAGPDTLASVSGTLATLMQGMQSADAPPSALTVTAITQRRAALAKLLQTWNTLQGADLAALNAQLSKASVPAVKIEETADPFAQDDDDEDDDIGD